MFGGRSSSRWVRHSVNFFKFQHATTTRPYCNSTALSNNKKHQPSDFDGSRNINNLRDLDNLNFAKAAKILFSTPPKKKNFGLDFHLVQLFFALMPSLAVYLVAQYARHDIRKMEAELELKRKAEEQQKAKEMAAAEEKEAESTSPELLKVKERLEALEETLKEIVVETKKRSGEEKSKNADQHQEGVDPNSRSDDSHIPAKSKPTNQEAASASQQPQKQLDGENRGSPEDDKK